MDGERAGEAQGGVTYGDPFVDFVGNLRKGTFLADVGDALAQVTQAVREHGRPGSLTLKFTVKPLQGDRTMLIVQDALTVKTPQAEKAETAFFALDDGRLSRRDPRQPELPFAVPRRVDVDVEVGGDVSDPQAFEAGVRNAFDERGAM